jgi:hypothetical protein
MVVFTFMEIWKSIFDNNYEISNYGNVKSNLFKTPRLLKPDNSTGYSRVLINKKWHSVHRLVAINFLDNKDNKPQVNHKDENKLNNNIYNLEWVTNRENIEYSLTKKGKSKIKGVNWIERMKTYQCSVFFNGRKHYLGSNKNIEIAQKIVEDFLIKNNLK